MLFRRLAVLISFAALASPLFPGETVPDSIARVWTVFDQLRASARDQTSTTFQFSEAEVNNYLRDSLKRKSRPGLKSLNVKFFPSQYISTFSVVNFDDLEKSRPGTVPTILRKMLSGDQTFWVDVRFHADKGEGTFSVEKAYLGKLQMPGILVEKAIQILAARQPEHYDTTKPVPLPFGLKSVWTNDKGIGGRT